MALITEKPKTPFDLGLLEDDDEFEEFTADDYAAQDVDNEDISVWEDNWDDDNVEDDFSKQLRLELNKPLPEDKKKRTNADHAADMKAREVRSQQAQQQVREEAEKTRQARK